VPQVLQGKNPPEIPLLSTVSEKEQPKRVSPQASSSQVCRTGGRKREREEKEREGTMYKWGAAE
jgi:hypothetical protein